MPKICLSVILFIQSDAYKTIKGHTERATLYQINVINYTIQESYFTISFLPLAM